MGARVLHLDEAEARFHDALHDAWRHAAETRAAVTLALVRIEAPQMHGNLMSRVHCALRWAMARNRDILIRGAFADFAVIFPHTTAAGARYIIERMQAIVGALDSGSPAGPVAASIGYASLRASGDATPALLTDQARAALHQAKPRSRAHE